MRVLASILVVLAVTLAIAALIVATSTAGTSTTIDDNARKREQQNLCVARLQAEYDVRVARAVLAPAGSRGSEVAALNETVDKLDDVQTCFTTTT